MPTRAPAPPSHPADRMRGPHRWRHLVAAVAAAASLVAGCATTTDEEATSETETTISTPSTETSTTVRAPGEREIYVVRNGDTLITIARRLGTDLNSLVRENNIADPTKIYVGQRLLVPLQEGEQDGPTLTIPPPTNPRLPPVAPTITLPAQKAGS